MNNFRSDLGSFSGATAIFLLIAWAVQGDFFPEPILDDTVDFKPNLAVEFLVFG